MPAVTATPRDGSARIHGTGGAPHAAVAAGAPVVIAAGAGTPADAAAGTPSSGTPINRKNTQEPEATARITSPYSGHARRPPARRPPRGAAASKRADSNGDHMGITKVAPCFRAPLEGHTIGRVESAGTRVAGGGT